MLSIKKVREPESFLIWLKCEPKTSRQSNTHFSSLNEILNDWIICTYFEFSENKTKQKTENQIKTNSLNQF